MQTKKGAIDHEDRIKELEKKTGELKSPRMDYVINILRKEAYVCNVLKSGAAKRWLTDRKFREKHREISKIAKDVGEEPLDKGEKPLKELDRIIRELDSRMFLIDGNKFEMGDGQDSNNPVHKVKLASFEISVTSVSQEQYQAVMGANPSQFKDPQKPVEFVSWNDAMEFCNRVSKETGRWYTLPTEAQWEYSCRAGSTTTYCFGDSEAELGEYARYRGNSGGTTHPVGEKKPNAWGIFDMHGNVWEWCSDYYSDDYYIKPEAYDNPEGPKESSYRVLRGGGWDIIARICRSAFRCGVDPTNTGSNLGFRVVRRLQTDSPLNGTGDDDA